MSKYLSDENLAILTNIISGVESYGQQYSTNRRWDAWADAFTNSQAQYSITIGWAQNYGDSALGLLKYIFQKYPHVYSQYDSADILSDIHRSSFVTQPYYQPTKGSAKANAIIAIITSPEGKKCQDEFFQKQMETYLQAAAEYGINTSNVPALMMWCEIRHLGGLKAAKRIFDRCGSNPSLDAIMSALQQDQNDSSSNNQVGDKVYWSRHECCYKWIKQYVKDNKGDNMSVNFSNYYNKISNSGHDENGQYNWGSAGDQTGTEWQVVDWYSRPWNVVLRHPDANTANLIAELAIEAANNNNIGYDQSERYTFWQQLKNFDYHPANITVPCEADCSAGVAAIVKAVGYLLNNGALQGVNSDSYTGNLRNVLINAGFTALTDSKYLNSSAYLKPGDVLLYEGHHTAINLGIGSNADYSAPAPVPGEGLSKESIKAIQTMLNTIGWNLEIDGSYGSATTEAVADMQEMYGLKCTGISDQTTIKKLESLVSFLQDEKYSVNVYRKNYPDLQAAYGDNDKMYFLHYYTYGKKEGRNCSTVIKKEVTPKVEKDANGIIIGTGQPYKTTVQKKGKISVRLLNVRRGPGTKYTNIERYPTIEQGEEVGVCDARKSNSGYVWYYIQVGKKVHGWVQSRYIKF